MDLDSVFAGLPDPSTHSFPEYTLPQGEPVRPVALTTDELDRLLDLYDAFAAVDPTGVDRNPFLQATSRFVERTLGTSLARPDEQLHDDIADTLDDFAAALDGASVGVVDVTARHHRTLYFFLAGCKGYHLAPHIAFDPDPRAVATLDDLYDRVLDQEFYLKRPRSVLE